MLRIVYADSEKYIDESEAVQKFREKYIKSFDDEDLFLEAICEIQYLAFQAGSVTLFFCYLH